MHTLPTFPLANNNCRTSVTRDQLLNYVDVTSGRAALHWASRYGQHAVLEWLVKSGAYYDLRDKEGMTPLHHTALYGQARAAKALIGDGANVNLRNRRGKTPLYVAAEHAQDAVGVLLLKAGAKTESLPWKERSVRGGRGGAGGGEEEGEVDSGKERGVDTVLDVVCREGLIGCARIIIANMEDFYEKELLTPWEQLQFECKLRVKTGSRVGKKPEILKKTDKTRVFSNKPVFSLGFFKAGFFQINQYTTI